MAVARQPRACLPALNDIQREIVSAHLDTLHRALNGDPKIKCYRKYWDSYEDFYQEAMLGVCIAAARWETPRGISFWTYAWHYVRQAVNKGRCGQSFRLAFGPKCISTGWQHFRSFVSLNTVGDFGGTSCYRTAISEMVGAEDNALLAGEAKEALEQLNATVNWALNARYNQILRRRSEGDSQQEIANDLNVSKQRVDQIEKKAASKCRDWLKQACPSHFDERDEYIRVRNWLLSEKEERKTFAEILPAV